MCSHRGRILAETVETYEKELPLTRDVRLSYRKENAMVCA